MTQAREEISLQDCWNVESLYPTLEVWEEELKQWQNKKGTSPFLDLITYRGTLSKNAAHFASFLNKYLNIDRALAKLYTYAHLRHDEDVGNDLYKQAYARVVHLLSEFREITAWVEPEILNMSKAQFENFLTDEALKEFHIYLEKIVRLKPHTLTADMEELLAQGSIALETAHKSFSAFNNGDLKFPKVVDSNGNYFELTHGKYQLYLKSEDPVLRESAFKTLHNSFSAYENTLCEMLQGQIQTHFFERRARKYSSCLEAALFPHHVDISVYKNLITSVRENLSSLHRYLNLRKKIMKQSELHLWDLSVPLVKAIDFSIDFDKAVDHVVASVSILGEEYQRELEKGLKSDRWVDRYENERKRSGAYSSGCYDSMPYILMNFQGTFSDLMTLSHEAGHSMHSLLSHRNQPYQYSHYPIFVAEVASTFNEELLTRYLLEKSLSKEEKFFLINQKIDDIRSTFYRQVMFAEFELKMHEWVESGVPLTPMLLKNEYHQLVLDYYGSEVNIDQEIDIEWGRIPHFYYNFYVYQYATGISAAFALVDRVYKEGKTARDDYLHFLSSGSAKFPLDLLLDAGVDMRKPAAVQATIHQFDKLVTELSYVL